MKHIVGEPWKYENIEYEIKDVMNKLKIDRMPVASELNEVTNSGSLTNAINQTGGFECWKINLNLVEKRKKSLNSKVTEETKIKMIELRKQGVKLRTIATKLNVSLDTVYRAVKGVKKDMEEVDKKLIRDTIRKYMFEGLDTAEIALKLKYTMQDVSKEITKIRLERNITPDETRRLALIKAGEEHARRKREEEKGWAEQLEREKEYYSEKYKGIFK
ncbi:MAG: helix-turn-helix domain-containing protein [Clostridium sp.]